MFSFEAMLQHPDTQPSHLCYVCMHTNPLLNTCVYNKFHLQPCYNTLMLSRLIFSMYACMQIVYRMYVYKISFTCSHAATP